jgi:SulP family sulfate permease
MYLTTLLATGFIGITQGILLGVLISLVFLVYKISVPHMAQLGRIPNSNVYRNVERFPDAQISNDLLIVRFDARLFYANMDYFKRQLVKFEQGKALKAIIIDASGINSVDSSAINMIKKLNVAYKRRGIQLLFAGLKGPVRDTFVMHKIYLHHGYDNFFVSIKEAEDALSGSLTKESKKITFQSNIT